MTNDQASAANVLEVSLDLIRQVLIKHETAVIAEFRVIIEAKNHELGLIYAERDEARKFGEEAAARYNAQLADQRILRCAFCAHEYPPETPPSQHEALTAHIRECAKHPLRSELDTLMLRSVGAMAIAEGQEGWEQVPIDCPMLGAVARLKAERDKFRDEAYELDLRIDRMVRDASPQ